jgi:hypothetical protein
MIRATMPVLLASMLALVTLSEWKQLQCEGFVEMKRYVNVSRGFSVGIPKGFQGRHGYAAGPDVGVGISLSARCETVVVVYAEPNNFESGSLQEAADFAIKITRDGALSPVSVEQYTTRLGRLKAIGVIIRHADSDDIEHVVIAFRPKGGLVYTARLATTTSRLQADAIVFKSVLKDFRLEPWR